MAFSTHDIVPDSPTNNFCTLNPLNTASSVTLNNGNLYISIAANAVGSIGTIAVTSGKWYWEFTAGAAASNSYYVSVCDTNFWSPVSRTQGDMFNSPDVFTYYGNNGQKVNNGAGTAYGSSFTDGDVIGVALDMDAGTVTFYKNNVSQGQAFSGLTGKSVAPFIGNGASGQSIVGLLNFGQDPTFGETKPVGNYAFNTAKIYSVFGGSERSANYTVEYSDDNSNWTTAWTGVMSNNTATGIQQGTGGGGSYGTHKYWRYVEGSAVVGHHPRISRIILSDGTNDTNLIVYNYDNSSDVGEYQPGTVAREISEGYTDTKGIGQFFYDPPSGALSLCTANLPDFTPTVTGDVPKEYFKTVLYTGNNSTNSISSVGFQPDLIWIKAKTDTRTHSLVDSVRGFNGSSAYVLQSDGIGGEFQSAYINSLDANGFTVSGSENYINNSSHTYVAWCWKAGGAPDLTTPKPFAKNGVQYETLSAANITAGTITPTAMSVNTDAGFSIVSWSGDDSNNKTLGHGLSKAPQFIVTKARNATTGWYVWADALAATEGLSLDAPDFAASFTYGTWGTKTSTTIEAVSGTNGINNVNGSEINYIAYCWHSVENYSKFGSYTGNGSPDGPFVYCGFRPAFVMVKNTSSTGSWTIKDTSRDTFNPSGYTLLADTPDDDFGPGNTNIDILSNGWKCRSSSTYINTTNNNYIFMAFAEQPFKFSNAR